MEFTKLSEVPKAIKEFYYTETVNKKVTLHVHAAGEHKTVSDIEHVIAVGRSNSERVINLFAPMVERGSQWRWFQSYLEYLTEHAAWTESKDAFEPVETSEDSGVFTEFTEVEPTEPNRPLAQTVEQILAPYFGVRRAAKLKEATITTSAGNTYDADEVSIHRLTMAKVALEGQADDYEMPWSLATDATGVMTTVTYADLKEAQLLAANNMSTNWSV